MLLVLLLSFSAWGWAIDKLRRREPLLPLEPRPPAPWGLLDGVVAVLILIIVNCGGALIYFGGKFPPADAAEQLDPAAMTGMLLLNGLMGLLTFGLSIVLTKLRTKATWAEMGFDAGKLWHDVQIGIFAFVMLAPPVYLIQMVLVKFFPQFHPLIELLRESPDVRIFLASGLSVCITAPLVEEYLFRGLLQGWLETLRRGVSVEGALMGSRYQYPGTIADVVESLPPVEPLEISENPYASPPAVLVAEAVVPETDIYPPVPRWPLFVSALIFALMHYSHGPAPIPLFFLALGLGYLYRQTHRLTPSIVVHFLLNSWTMVLLLIEVYAPLPKP